MRGSPVDRTARAIGERLRATREALGINQAELCRRCNIRTNTYNQWEKGQRPEIDGAIRLVDGLDLTLDWIYLGDPARLPYEVATSLVNGTRRSGRRP